MIPADIPAVAALERSTFSTPWQRETFERFLDGSSGVEVWIAEGPGPEEDWDALADGGFEPQVLGYAVLWTAADQGELANLAVRPAARGRGLGGQLLDRVLQRCADLDLVALYLEVRSSNEAATALYEARDFRTVGVRKNYYTSPREDAQVMMKSFAGTVDGGRRG